MSSTPRKPRPLTVGAQTFPTAAAAAAHFGIAAFVVRARRSRGLTPEQCVGLEPLPENTRIAVTIEGRLFASHADAARHFNISDSTFSARIDRGWSPEEAAELTVRKRRRQPQAPRIKYHEKRTAALVVAFREQIGPEATLGKALRDNDRVVVSCRSHSPVSRRLGALMSRHKGGLLLCERCQREHEHSTGARPLRIRDTVNRCAAARVCQFVP
jgi:hypothetical protein